MQRKLRVIGPNFRCSYRLAGTDNRLMEETECPWTYVGCSLDNSITFPAQTALQQATTFVGLVGWTDICLSISSSRHKLNNRLASVHKDKFHEDLPVLSRSLGVIANWGTSLEKPGDCWLLPLPPAIRCSKSYQIAFDAYSGLVVSFGNTWSDYLMSNLVGWDTGWVKVLVDAVLCFYILACSNESFGSNIEVLHLFQWSLSHRQSMLEDTPCIYVKRYLHLSELSCAYGVHSSQVYGWEFHCWTVYFCLKFP